MADEYVKQALLLSRDIGNNLNEFHCLCDLSVLKVSSGHFEEGSSIFFKASRSSTLWEVFWNKTISFEYLF